jgi:hypothetical protein
MATAKKVRRSVRKPAPSRVGTLTAMLRGAAVVAEDEVLVFVVGRRGAVAKSLRVPASSSSRRHLELGVAGAALAVTALGRGSANEVASTELGQAEAALLREGGFERAPAGGTTILPSDEGALAYLLLLEASLDVDEAAALLGVNTSRVRQRLGARTLYGVKDGRGWRLPSFQFAGKRLVPGVDQVFAELAPTLHPVAVERWFSARNPDLGLCSPLEWLRRGNDPAVVADLASEL